MVSSYDYLILKSNSGTDTLHRFAFNVNLLDYLVINEKNVNVVIETPIAFFHYSFTKKGKEWLANKTSGQIASNYGLLSFPDLNLLSKQPDPKTFEILKENLVQFYTKNGKLKKVDCLDIKKRRELWEKKCSKFDSNKKH